LPVLSRSKYCCLTQIPGTALVEVRKDQVADRIEDKGGDGRRGEVLFLPVHGGTAGGG
jgi:hypothetical protein